MQTSLVIRCGSVFSLSLAKSSVVSLQDLSEDLFTQETDFPTTLLLGLEGVFGLYLAIPLYFILGPLVGEIPSEAFAAIGANAGSVVYTVFLVILAGLYQILSTAVTSSMTRNVWKNFHGLLVWLVSLVAFYASGATGTFGEPWRIPSSLMFRDYARRIVRLLSGRRYSIAWNAMRYDTHHLQMKSNILTVKLVFSVGSEGGYNAHVCRSIKQRLYGGFVFCLARVVPLLLWSHKTGSAPACIQTWPQATKGTSDKESTFNTTMVLLKHVS